jgi:AcrR family transcriptional regulator
LLSAAELLLQERGADGVSVREVASRAGTSVQAVYSVFGSKEALLGALGARAMEILQVGVDAVAVTEDPVHDLAEASLVFRRFALEHPALFEVAFQRVDPVVWPRFEAASADALQALTRRFHRLVEARLLPRRSLREAVLAFHATCEGLAGIELRGRVGADLDPEHLWRVSCAALLNGFIKT